ncbi:basic salivary proline-rich protein 2-like [Apus apus]|uniref:basic salivary proline-rich protein 2-like n=1 Tax=Apus apus TaxID=8895 RepID=UPI0021F85B13|nr:basic salivary proline-rich protein 2-like [Apus apus]
MPITGWQRLFPGMDAALAPRWKAPRCCFAAGRYRDGTGTPERQINGQPPTRFEHGESCYLLTDQVHTPRGFPTWKRPRTKTQEPASPAGRATGPPSRGFPVPLSPRAAGTRGEGGGKVGEPENAPPPVETPPAPALTPAPAPALPGAGGHGGPQSPPAWPGWAGIPPAGRGAHPRPPISAAARVGGRRRRGTMRWQPAPGLSSGRGNSRSARGEDKTARTVTWGEAESPSGRAISHPVRMGDQGVFWN